MDKADRQLLEVVEIWPSLSTWQKYRLLILAMWWAKVIHPVQSLLRRTGLGENIAGNWMIRFLITGPVILIFSAIGLSISKSLIYSLFVLFLALACAVLSVFDHN
jgi:hypothetical protein